MKNWQTKIWYLIAAYLIVGYIFPVLFRARFMIPVFVIVTSLSVLELKLKDRIVAVAMAIMVGLFFYKIIPSPFPFFINHGYKLSVGILFTVLAIFLISSLLGVIVHSIFDRIEKKIL